MRSGVSELLLAPGLAPGRAEELIRPFRFASPLQADRELQALAADPEARRLLAGLLEDVLGAAAASPDPDGALSRLERFVRAAGSAARVFSHLRADRRMVDVLLRTLGASPFLAEILIRQPNWLYWLSEGGVLQAPRPREEMAADLARALGPLASQERRHDALRVAKRREILRIAVRDLLRLATVEETLRELSALAEVLIEGALDPADGFAVLALGKLGGGELNFSSDVDLVFVYRGARRAFHHGLARRLTAALADVTAEGYVYRVDLRLRPEGGAGPIALPLSAFAAYYRTRGSAWERLALLKAAPVAGDAALGAQAVERTRAFVFGRPWGPPERAEMRRVKKQSDARLAARGEGERHVKLGHGGIREIEFAVQTLQAAHGRRGGLDARGTLDALDALAARGLLAEDDHVVLRAAYLFLRDVENKLQMVADAQTHLLPDDPAELRRCALRLGYPAEDAGAADALRRDHRRHAAAVHAVFERVTAVPAP